MNPEHKSSTFRVVVCGEESGTHRSNKENVLKKQDGVLAQTCGVRCLRQSRLESNLCIYLSLPKKPQISYFQSQVDSFLQQHSDKTLLPPTQTA